MLLGRSFAGEPSTLLSVLPDTDTINTLTLENAIHDETYVSLDIVELDDFDGKIPSDWTFNTRLHSQYNEDLYGGNVSFTEAIVESVRIKKRTSKDSKFQTIYEKPINTNEDFEIHLMDYYEPVGDVEYAYVPVISGGENKYITNTVVSDFDHFFMCEKDTSYQLIMNASFNRTLNQKVGVVETWGRQRPVIIKNGNMKYYSGDIECIFVELKECQYQFDTGWEYRNELNEFLSNGKPKIFKDSNGNLYMISITSNITESTDKSTDIVTSKFSVAECGDAYYTGDLYDNGFIDTDLDR